MKRILFIFALVMGLSFSAMARGEYAHDDSVLPEPAKNTISNKFDAKVSLVKIEKKFGKVDEYEVILTNGTEVTFDRSGNWKEIETSIKSEVPNDFIPKAMKEFVKKNHKNAKIVGLEKDSKGYEAELSNGIELKFDTSGNFLRYDN